MGLGRVVRLACVYQYLRVVHNVYFVPCTQFFN